MDKQELLNKKSELEKELGQVNKELWDYDVKQLAEQYKDKFTCLTNTQSNSLYFCQNR